MNHRVRSAALGATAAIVVLAAIAGPKLFADEEVSQVRFHDVVADSPASLEAAAPVEVTTTTEAPTTTTTAVPSTTTTRHLGSVIRAVQPTTTTTTSTTTTTTGVGTTPVTGNNGILMGTPPTPTSYGPVVETTCDIEGVTLTLQLSYNQANPMASLALDVTAPTALTQVRVEGTVGGSPFFLGGHMYTPRMDVHKYYEGEVTDEIVVTSVTCTP